MKKNGTTGSVIKLWGHEFNLAQKGLDETQVVSFVNGLIDERDMLAQRQEHFTSLTKLAEKTVAEADKLAEDINKEAREQAKAEANEIIAKAKEQAQQLFEEERAKIITTATEEATVIKTNAEREADLLLENQRKRIQPELREIAQGLYGQLLAQFESLKQQAVALEAEFELKLSQPAEEANTVAIEQEPSLTPALAATQQGNATTSGTSPEVSLEGMDDVPPEFQQLNQTIDLTKTNNLEEKAPVSADNQDTNTYEDEIELEILPPIDIMKIMGIMRYLDSLPKVENTELIPIADRPLIIASLREPMSLIDILMALPEVEQVKEVTNGETTAITGDIGANGERRKIQITLSGKTVLDEAKG